MALEGLKRMWEDEEMKDAVLVVGNSEIKAHKCLLVAHSKAFADWFQLDIEDARAGRLEISGSEPKTVKQMLELIYLEKKPTTESDVEDLFNLADKYIIPDVKSCCLTILTSWLSAENVVTRYKMAVMHNAKDLLLESNQFIWKKWTQLINTKEWKEETTQDPGFGFKLLVNVINGQKNGRLVFFDDDDY